MFTKEKLFKLSLEDYSYPRSMSTIKSYYGSMESMIEFLNRMEDDSLVATRYKETLDAAEYYDLDNELTHTVAGTTEPIFTPVEELSRLETTLYNKEWVYEAYNGQLYPCRADSIYMRQSMVETEDGYELCVQANITGLQICYPGIGWMFPNGVIKGFPYMVTFDGTSHCMALASTAKFYEFEESDVAYADALNPNAVDLSVLVEDILAEG